MCYVCMIRSALSGLLKSASLCEYHMVINKSEAVNLAVSTVLPNCIWVIITIQYFFPI